MTTRNDPNERMSEFARTTAGQHSEERSLTDRAAEVRDRAQDAAEQARRRAEQAGHQATDRVDSAMNTTGDRLQDAAQALRERAPSGQVGQVAEKAADALERGGDYLRRSDVNAVRGDLETIIRDHPIESLAVGVGIGFLIARSMRSRRG